MSTYYEDIDKTWNLRDKKARTNGVNISSNTLTASKTTEKTVQSFIGDKQSVSIVRIYF